MTTDAELQDDKPLDPAAEKLRRKLVRLLVISMGFLILSVMTVFGVIIYKTTTSTPSVAVYDGSPIAVSIPGGGEIVNTALDGDRALLTVRGDGGTKLVVVSMETGMVIGVYTVELEGDIVQPR